MIMKQNNITLSELLVMIERYFDCALSDMEEDRLRGIIAETKIKHPAVDEIKAVMGFRQHRSGSKKRDNFRIVRIVTSVAAAVVVVIAVGLKFQRNFTMDDRMNSTCIAYVNGKCITDEDEIMFLIAEDMHEFNAESEETSQEFREELEEVLSDISYYESEINIFDI